MSSVIPQNELARLKEQVIRAIITNHPLPGSDRPVNFPDRDFVLSQPEVYLLDDDLKNNIRVESLATPVQLITATDLAKLQETSEKVIFLKFHTSSLSQDRLNLRLDAKIQSAGDSRQHSLTSMEMKFSKFDNGWQISEEPTSLST